MLYKYYVETKNKKVAYFSVAAIYTVTKCNFIFPTSAISPHFSIQLADGGIDPTHACMQADLVLV